MKCWDLAYFPVFSLIRLSTTPGYIALAVSFSMFDTIRYRYRLGIGMGVLEQIENFVSNSVIIKTLHSSFQVFLENGFDHILYVFRSCVECSGYGNVIFLGLLNSSSLFSSSRTFSMTLWGAWTSRSSQWSATWRAMRWPSMSWICNRVETSAEVRESSRMRSGLLPTESSIGIKLVPAVFPSNIVGRK